MNIYFQESTFTDAMSWDGLAKVKKAIKERPAFTYENVDYQTFTKKYDLKQMLDRLPKRGWVWITAPCQALFGGAKAVHHAAKAVFSLVRCSNRSLNFRVNMYSAARDLEGSLGRLISLIDGKYGLYLIERAQFHQKCYEYVLNHSQEDKTDQNSSSSVEKKRAKKISEPHSYEVETKTDDDPKVKPERENLQDDLNRLARGLIGEGKYVDAEAVIDQIRDGKKKSFLFKLMTEFLITEELKSDQLEKIFFLIQKIEDKNMHGDSMGKFAGACVEKGDTAFALKVIQSLSRVDERDPHYVSLCNRLIEEKSYKQAFDQIGKISSSDERAPLYARLGSLFEEGEQWEKAFQSFHGIHRLEQREAHFERLAKKLIENVRGKLASKVIGKIDSPEKREPLYLSLINDYRNEENWEAAIPLLERLREADQKFLLPFLEISHQKERGDWEKTVLSVAARPILMKKFEKVLNVHDQHFSKSSKKSLEKKNELGKFYFFLKKSDQLSETVEAFSKKLKEVNKGTFEELKTYLIEEKHWLSIHKEFISI